MFSYYPLLTLPSGLLSRVNVDDSNVIRILYFFQNLYNLHALVENCLLQFTCEDTHQTKKVKLIFAIAHIVHKINKQIIQYLKLLEILNTLLIRH